MGDPIGARTVHSLTNYPRYVHSTPHEHERPDTLVYVYSFCNGLPPNDLGLVAQPELDPKPQNQMFFNFFFNPFPLKNPKMINNKVWEKTKKKKRK